MDNDSELKRLRLFDEVALHVISYLEAQDSLKIDFKSSVPVASHEVGVWERNNALCTISKDLKEFYNLFNGVNMSWRIVVAEKRIKIGLIQVSKLELLRPLAKEISDTFPLGSRSNYKLLLYSSAEHGKTIMVPKRTEGGNGVNDQFEFWFLDTCSRWHYLCESFTQHLRLQIVHLGIIGWELAFTPEGVTPQCAKWMQTFCRERHCNNLFHSQSMQREN
jgi:hypothetical protein